MKEPATVAVYVRFPTDGSRSSLENRKSALTSSIPRPHVTRYSLPFQTTAVLSENGFTSLANVTGCRSMSDPSSRNRVPTTDGVGSEPAVGLAALRRAHVRDRRIWNAECVERRAGQHH